MKQFVPLECNPDVFNSLLLNAGVSGVEFHDVFSLEPDLLAFVPRPVLAILLVFPLSPTYEAWAREQDAGAAGAAAAAGTGPDGEALWYPQTIGNACGTMAFLHAVANAVPDAQVAEPLRTLLAETRGLDAAGRAGYLERSDAFEALHGSVAAAGATAAPAAGDDVEFHYVALTTARNSRALVELDGRRRGPIVRGPPVDDLLGEETLAVVREFLDREQGSGAFSIIALTASEGA